MKSAKSNHMSNPSHILIADDERSIRLMLETGLTLNGFRVTSARNGREALEAVSTQQVRRRAERYLHARCAAAWNWWTRCAPSTRICRSC